MAASRRQTPPPSAGLDPPHERLQQGPVQRVLQHLVLDAGIDVRVVVDLDHEDAAVVLLEVDAVQALAHQPGRGHRSEEHTSELQSLMRSSYAAFCLKQNNHSQ